MSRVAFLLVAFLAFTRLVYLPSRSRFFARYSYNETFKNMSNLSQDSSKDVSSGLRPSKDSNGTSAIERSGTCQHQQDHGERECFVSRKDPAVQQRSTIGVTVTTTQERPLVSTSITNEHHQQICLLPIGDSITRQYTPSAINVGYRWYLWRDLIDLGLKVNFTGSMVRNVPHPPQPHLKCRCNHSTEATTSTNTCACPPDVDPLLDTKDGKYPYYKGNLFPMHHEGHGGWRSDQLLYNTVNWGPGGKGNIHEWWPNYNCTPDCILLHIGTNDMKNATLTNRYLRTQGKLGTSFFDVESLPDEATKNEITNEVNRVLTNIDALIDFIKEKNPISSILIAAPIPTCHPTVGAFLSPRVIKRYGEKKYGDRGVFVVDQHTGFEHYEDTRERLPVGPGAPPGYSIGCHPNNKGGMKMAKTWLPAVQTHCFKLPV